MPPRRDLSSWGRTLFWALLGLLIAAGIFLDVFNVFLLAPDPLGGRHD